MQVSDHWLPFTVPAGLMPDPQLDGLSAELQVHRVQPVYANGKRASVPNRAAVLIHGGRPTVPRPEQGVTRPLIKRRST